MSTSFAVLEQRGLVAHRAHRASACDTITIVLPLAAELGELLGALALELLVADGEHLVDEQDVGVDVDRDREPEPHVHARRVVLHRRVDEVLEAGEVDDLVEALVELLLAQARGSSR